MGIVGGVCGICVWGVEGRPLGGRLLGRLVNTHVNVCAKLGFWLLWMGWVYVGVVSRQVVGPAGEYPCECLCKTCVLGAVDFPVDFLVDFFLLRIGHFNNKRNSRRNPRSSDEKFTEEFTGKFTEEFTEKFTE